MTENLDKKFIIIKRKAILRGSNSSDSYFLEHSQKTKVEDREIIVGFDNKDIFYAAQKVEYKIGDEIEYEIRVPVKK